MKAGMSARFQAATCASRAAWMAASSATCGGADAACAAWAGVGMAAEMQSRAGVRASKSPRRIDRLVPPGIGTVCMGVHPGSAYNGSMSAATASSPFRLVHTVCSHGCPDSCGVLVTVDGNGRAIKVAGDPNHPVTQGFLCGKVAKYLDRVYAPDRILYPLRRKAGVAKGPLVRGREHAAFERVSWDEALETIAARLKGVADEFGTEAILPYSYAGTIGVLGYGSMDRRFFHRLGASQLDRTICSTTGGDALL